MPKDHQKILIEYAIENNGAAELMEYQDLKFVIYNDKMNRSCLKVWKGRQSKPFENYYFKSIETRDAHINGHKERAQERFKFIQKRKTERKAFVPEFKVGDIYVASWGYEQTNVNFYEVVEKASKHYAILREICCQTVPGSTYSHGMASNVVPQRGQYRSDETLRKKITQSGNKQVIKICSVKYASSWDGKPTYESSYH